MVAVNGTICRYRHYSRGQRFRMYARPSVLGQVTPSPRVANFPVARYSRRNGISG